MPLFLPHRASVIPINFVGADRIFFTGDQHFGHENIIKFCNRSFNDVGEMDQALIRSWNEMVRPSDTVFHLGDLTLGDAGVARGYIKELNGKIYVLSNPWHHDKRWLGETYFTRSGYQVEYLPPVISIEIPELGEGKHPLSIMLCHYPMAEWDRKHHKGWHLHAHSHGNHHAEGYIMDVGVDATNGKPISLRQVVERMESLGWKRPES